MVATSLEAIEGRTWYHLSLTLQAEDPRCITRIRSTAEGPLLAEFTMTPGSGLTEQILNGATVYPMFYAYGPGYVDDITLEVD